MSNETNIFQIEIPKRSPKCMQGNEPLMPEMEYYSILLSDKEKSYQRYDFCSHCWENFAKTKFHNTFKIAWKAKIATKNEIEDLSNQTRDEKAFYLLKNALQNPNQEDWAEIFILALYLARRKILLLRQELSQEDGSTFCIYEVAATEEMLSIKRKSFNGIDISEIQSKIAQKLC